MNPGYVSTFLLFVALSANAQTTSSSSTGSSGACERQASQAIKNIAASRGVSSLSSLLSLRDIQAIPSATSSPDYGKGTAYAIPLGASAQTAYVQVAPDGQSILSYRVIDSTSGCLVEGCGSNNGNPPPCSTQKTAQLPSGAHAPTNVATPGGAPPPGAQSQEGGP